MRTVCGITLMQHWSAECVYMQTSSLWNYQEIHFTVHGELGKGRQDEAVPNSIKGVVKVEVLKHLKSSVLTQHQSCDTVGPPHPA